MNSSLHPSPWLTTLLASLALLLPAGGCAKRARPAASAQTLSAEPETPSEHGLCFAPRHPNLAKQQVRAHDWLSLMTRLELGRGGVFATRDCLGRWINYAPLSNACGTAAYAQTQPRRMAVAEETVIVRDLVKACRDLAAAGQTIVLVEQNLAATLALASRVYIINNGHIVHEGPAQEIKAQPDILQRYLGV